MASIDLSPVGLAAGAPALGAPRIDPGSLVAPGSIAAGAPVIPAPGIKVYPELWPFVPLVGATETLEWMSEVLSSRTGEQRIALRSAPRQYLEFRHRLTEEEFSRAKAIARRRGTLEFGLPVWTERVRIGPVSPMDTVIPVNTETGDYREGGYLVLWESTSRHVVREIDSIDPDFVTLAAPAGVDMTSAWVMPARKCIASGGFRFSRNSARRPMLEVKFRVIDNTDLSDGFVSPFETHDGLDVMSDPSAVVQDLSENIIRAVDEIDNGFGPVVIEPVKDYDDFGQQVFLIDQGLADLWRRRRWLHARRGMQKAFWLPSHNRDLILKASVAADASAISVASIGPLRSYAGRHIMVRLQDGTTFYRRIVDVAKAGGNDVLTISAALGRPVSVGDVHRISFLSKVRLNSDEITIQHEFPGLARTELIVTEVPE